MKAIMMMITMKEKKPRMKYVFNGRKTDFIDLQERERTFQALGMKAPPGYVDGNFRDVGGGDIRNAVLRQRLG